MNEIPKPLSRDERHRLSMDAKTAANQARLKAALRSNLRRRKKASIAPENNVEKQSETDQNPSMEPLNER